MSDMHIKTGASTWKAMAGIYIKTAASTWKAITNAYIKTGASTWKEFYAAFAVSLAGGTSQGNNFSGGSASAGWRSTADGALQRMIGGIWTDYGVEWGDPQTTDVGDNYWIKVDQNSGDTPTVSSGFGTWLNMGATRTYSWTQDGVGTKNANLTISIATDAGGLNVIATDTYLVSVNVESGA